MKQQILKFYSELKLNDQPLFSPQTNALYCAAFEEWAAQFTNVKILSDQTTTNEVKNMDLNKMTVLKMFCLSLSRS